MSRSRRAPRKRSKPTGKVMRDRMLDEREGAGRHLLPEPRRNSFGEPWKEIYRFDDLIAMADGTPPRSTYIQGIRSLDELLERDRLREEDGFPRKIQVGRLIKPGRGGKDKVVVVPTTVEEKLIHDRPSSGRPGEGSSGGSGEGEEGEVIGEEPVHAPNGAGAGGAGQGEGGPHEIESSAYDLGKILTEKFQLPNLKDKGKKRSLTRYTYDMTDRHRGAGQILDKKATLRRLLETNLNLGNIEDIESIDPTTLLVGPDDLVYRILSEEKDYESQAMVFFVRDYSGSMVGRPTELVVSQHVLIYSWLLFQYARQVESRFILHDTEAKEVEDFYTYYSSSVAGGTQIASAYRLVNELVHKDSLDRDYNIYVFHGTDGDDWDSDGSQVLPELREMLGYTSRVGISVTKRQSGVVQPTVVESYLRSSKLLDERPQEIRMDVIPEDADEPRLIEGIKKIIS
jgi:uncharacterized sporulation protein YeaH/YhbH (DUF444 family)